jgi:hypothetical protein
MASSNDVLYFCDVADLAPRHYRFLLFLLAFVGRRSDLGHVVETITALDRGKAFTTVVSNETPGFATIAIALFLFTFSLSLLSLLQNHGWPSHAKARGARNEKLTSEI